MEVSFGAWCRVVGRKLNFQSSPDLLKDEEWDAVLDGNQLFYAYHVPVSVNEKLKQLEDQIPKPSSNEDSKPADNNKKTTKPSSNEDSKPADKNKNNPIPGAENNNTGTKAADGVSGKDILDASMNGTMDEELETPEIFVQALRPGEYSYVPVYCG